MARELDTEERASMMLGALEAVTQLCEYQVPGLSMPSEQLAPLLRLLTMEAEKVLPIDRRKPHGLPANNR